MVVRSVILIATLCLLPSIVLAQDPPTPAPVDTTGLASPDSSTTVPDSSTTDRLLAVESQANELVEVIAPVGFGDLQPVGSRLVLNRDSIEWLPGRTVGELIAAVAPAYLWRGGWQVRTEMPNVFGRGAGSVEYVRDGLPVIALGADSVSVDPSIWSLNFIERIEIERLPGRLRVFLYSRNNDRVAPATRIAISTGDRGFARYVGSFDKKFGSGLGFSVAADYSNVDAPELGTGRADLTNIQGRLSWRINTRLTSELTHRVSTSEREPLLSDASTPPSYPDTLDPGLIGRRTDTEFRLAWRKPESRLGLRADGWVANSKWADDSSDRKLTTVGGIVGFRQPSTSAELQVLHRSLWTPIDSRLALAWAPTPWVSGATEAVYQSHSEKRTSKYVTARLGLKLHPSVTIGAVASSGERVDAPSLIDLEAQSFSDYEVFLAIAAGPATVEGRLTSTDVWQPIPFRQFLAVNGLARQPRTNWLALKATLRPNSWFTLASHYEHPQGFIIPDGVPPHHAWSTATINSRFLRNFASGIFRLKVQAVVETWSPGIIGRDVQGEAIELPGLTFVRGIIQFKIGPFTAFWDRVNFQATDNGTVPGYPILNLGSSYGIRWSFTN